MMRKNETMWGLITALLMFAILLGACAAPTKPLPVEKQVTYLSLADYTGPCAGLAVASDWACADYFRQLNEKGGVEGIKVNFVGIDTRYDAARSLSAYKRYRTTPKLLFVNAYGTHMGQVIAPLARQDGISSATPFDATSVANPDMAFLWGPAYADQFGAICNWMIDDWKAKGKSGLPVIGYVSWDAAASKEPWLGGKEYMDKVGITVLPYELYPIGTLDFTPYLNRLVDGGANYAIVGGVDPVGSLVIRDAYKLGLTKDIQFVVFIFGPDEAVGIKLHPEACEGAVQFSPWIVGVEARAHPWIQLFVKYRGGKLEDLPAGMYINGCLFAYRFEQGLKRALKDVTYDKLDGLAMFAGLKRLTGIDQQGAAGPIAFSETERRATWDIKAYRTVGGKNIPISGWIRCPDCVSLHKW